MAGTQDIVWRSTIDDSQFIAAMDRMINASAKFDEEMKATGKVSDETLNALGDSAVSISNDFEEMEGRMVKVRAESGNLKKAAKNLFGELKDGTKRIIDYVKGLRQTGSATDEAAAAAGKATTFFGRMGTAALKLGKTIAAGLVASGIGILLAALAGLYAFLTRTEKGMNIVKQAVAGVTAAINVFIDRAEYIGAAFSSFFKGNFKEGFDNLKASVDGLGKELLDEAAAAAALERAFQSLEAAQVDLERRTIALRATLAENSRIAEDETKSYKDRIEALKNSLEIENVLGTERILQAEENVRLVEAEQALRADSLDKQKKINEANLKLLDAQEEAENKRRAILNDIKAIDEERRKTIDEERKRVAALEKAYEKLAGRLEDQVAKAAIANADGLEKLALQRDFAIKQVQEFADELRKAAKDAGKILSPEQEKDIQRLFDAIDARYNEEYTKEVVKQLKDRMDAEEKAAQQQQEIIDATYERELDFIGKRQQLQLAELDLIKEGSDKSLTLEEEKELRRLEIQRQAFTDQLALAQERFGPDSQEVQLLEAQLAAIAAAMRRVENGVGPVLSRLKQKILETFHIDAAQLDFIVSNFQTIFDSIGQLSQANLEAELTANQELIDSTRQRVDDIQSQLEREQQYKEDGLSNNVSALQQALAEETAALAAAEAQRLALEREAANKRLVADALQQGSKLALAAANVITAESSKGLIGIITATAGLALLFSIFAQAKANAAQYSTPQKLRKGGRLDGPPHEYGGLAVTVDGELIPRYEAEGGEFVLNRQTTERHLDFITRLNEGEFDSSEFEQILKSLSPKRYRTNNLRRMAKAAKRDPLRYTVPKIRRISSQLEQWNEAKHFKSLENVIQETTERSTENIIEYFKGRPIIQPLDQPVRKEYWKGGQKVTEIIKPVG